MNHDEDDVIRLLRQVLRDDDGDIPTDLQPPPTFWDQLARLNAAPADLPEAATAPGPPRVHRQRRYLLLIAAACVAAAISVATVVAHQARNDAAPVAQPTTPASAPAATPSASQPTENYALYRPAGYPDSTCVPGSTIHPTRTPRPAADSFTATLNPNTPQGSGDHIADPRQPFYTHAFEPITEAGGCVQAWILPHGYTPPNDATSVAINGTKYHKRINTDGLTEVYLKRNQTLYIAASGNTTAHDLALALDASTTP